MAGGGGVCGPQAKPGEPSIAGCWTCGSKVGHRHIVVLGRDGNALGRVAACADHAPSGVAVPSNGPELVVQPRREVPSGSERKRRRDRERRRAQKVVLDRHSDEYREVLDQIREVDR